MTIETFQVGQLKANCYLLYDEEGAACIIDPGDDGDFLSEKILEKNLNLTHVLLTHAHFDHILGILPLKLNFSPRILLHKDDLFLYKKSKTSAKYWIGVDSDPLPEPDKFVKEGDRINIGKIDLEVIEAPGHTPGSVCYYVKNEKTLFTGDLLFKGAVGRTDFSYSSEEELYKSIKKIKNLPGETIIFPGHGDEVSLQNSLDYMPLQHT